jgi:hypothetical protein
VKNVRQISGPPAIVMTGNVVANLFHLETKKFFCLKFKCYINTTHLITGKFLDFITSLVWHSNGHLPSVCEKFPAHNE